MSASPAHRPPVIVLGGNSSALSVVRSLGRLGVPVYTVGVPRHVEWSRYARALPVGTGHDEESAWAACLLGPAAEALAGAVVLAASDAGISVIANHRGRLLERFRLDDSDVEAQRLMLDKLGTYETARDAGVPTPRFWRVSSVADVLASRDELVFPLIVKPILSHEYQARFTGKFREAADLEQLLSEYREVTDSGLEVMLVEKIGGGDDRLCSAYTYMDRAGRPTFHFTKRIIRRHPAGMGGACYHITDWNPEVMDLSLRLFRHAGLRGVANAEFKRDPRDGGLKLIECNARFTAANCLVESAGIDLARHVYRQVIDEPDPLPKRYREGMRLWYPSDDLRALVERRQAGELGPLEWARSVAHRQTFPFFRAGDPAPAFVRAGARVGRGVKRMPRLRPAPGRPVAT